MHATCGDGIIKWLSLKNTIEYVGEWEAMYNPDFNYTEFGTIKNMSGGNNFVLSVKQWIERTDAIGLLVKNIMTKLSAGAQILKARAISLAVLSLC